MSTTHLSSSTPEVVRMARADFSTKVARLSVRHCTGSTDSGNHLLSEMLTTWRGEGG